MPPVMLSYAQVEIKDTSGIVSFHTLNAGDSFV